MIPILITEQELAKAEQLADETLRRFGGQPGFYNNTRNSHLRGKLGEIACARWLVSNEIELESLFEDVGKVKDCDVIAKSARSLRLDVKTWDTRYWEEMGRCVAVGQLKSLRAKADAIMWCVSPSGFSAGMQIDLVGWSTMEDVASAPRRMTGPAGRRQVDNHQVDATCLRDCTELLQFLREPD